MKEEEGIPRRFQNPVAIPTDVFEGLETVQVAREASMLDHLAVQEIANRLGCPKTATWIREHPHEYLEGVSRGFVVAK